MVPGIATYIFLHFSTSFVRGNVLNITNLMLIYMNMCGEEYLCYEWPGMVGYTVNQCHSKCPPCSCNEDCFKNETCCPDVFFIQRQEQEAFITPFLYQSPTDDLLIYDQYAMVTQCPSNADSNTKEMCEISSNENIKRLFPVTSSKTNYTYRNHMCAACHDEDDSDLIQWTITTGKTHQIAISVINVISSFQSLFNFSQLANQKTVLFAPPDSISSRIIRTKTSEFIQESCPIDIDLDIKLACFASYVRPYRNFKNIFCYVCDFYNYFSPSYGKNLIDTCNKEFYTSSNFLSIKHACSENPPTVVTYPFKNIYCYICNTYSDTTRMCSDFQMSETWHTSDAFTFSVSEAVAQVKGNWRRQYRFENIQFRLKKIMEQIANVKLNDKIRNDANQTSHNLTEIVLKLAAVFPEKIYNKHLLPSTIQNFPPTNCDNKLSCIFHSQCDCCVDTAFTRPVTCLEYFADGIKNERAPMVVHDCLYSMSVYPTELYLVLRHLCTKNYGTIQSIPVYSKNITYINVFCFLCSTKFTITDEQIFMEDHKILPLNILCDFTLPYLYMTNFSNILETAKSLKCDIILDTENVSLCFNTKHHENSRCLSSLPDEDEERNEIWSCSRHKRMNSFTWIQKYAWDFCLECQLERPIPVHVDQCSHSRRKEACNLLPTVRGHPLISPYKNIYCKVCSSNCSDCFGRVTYSLLQTCDITKGRKYEPIMNSYRDLFLPTVKMQLNQRIEGTLEEPKELGCFPGRVLIDDKCELLLPVAEHLNYVVTFQADVKVTSTESPSAWIEPLRESAKSQIGAYLGKKIYNYFFLPANFVNFLGNHTTEFSCFLHMIVNFVGPFDRDEVEKRFTTMSESIHFFGVLSNQTRYEIKGNHLITTKRAIDLALNTKNIWYKDEYNQFLEYVHKYYRPAMVTLDIIQVSYLLFCRLEILPTISQTGNFNFSKHHITFIPTKKSYGIGEFVVYIDGRVGVCEEKVVSKIFSFLDERLTLLTLVCNYCSVFFLFILLLTYIAFDTLRTIPGLILMNDVISLICTQLIFTIINFLETGSSVCLIIGIMLHYFWLSLSCSQFICCLHMCRVFALSKGLQLSNSKKTFYYYVVFTYTVPLLLVAISITTNLYRNGSIGYGMTICFVEDFFSNLLTFVVPLVTSCFANIVLFLTTLGAIICRTKVQKSKEDASYFVISLKLFSVTGGIFVFTIIDTFLQLSAFSFFTSLLTSLQGVFIFISFFTSRNAFSIFKKQLTRNRGDA